MIGFQLFVRPQTQKEKECVACENIRLSLLFAAGDVSAAKSEEKRMFSQAKECGALRNDTKNGCVADYMQTTQTAAKAF